MLVYLRTAEGNDALAWVDKDGNNVTQSQFEILEGRRVFCRTHPRRPGRKIIIRSSEKASSLSSPKKKLSVVSSGVPLAHDSAPTNA